MEVKLHHNGYAIDPKHPDRYARKMERNLSLLDKELERDPHNLLRLLQGLESAGLFPARQMDYARRAMDVLSNCQYTSDEKRFGAIICTRALRAAAVQRMPELDQWREWAFSNYAGNLFLRTDGNFALLKYYIDQKQFVEIPGLAEAFLCAWQDYHDRNFSLEILKDSIVESAPRKFEIYARISSAEALAHLGQNQEAAALLAGE